MPAPILKRWPAASDKMLTASPGVLADLPIDQSVGLATLDGGSRMALQQARSFVNQRLDRYADERNQPDNDPSSGLSPYLHFGHIAAHRVFQMVAGSEEWTVDDLRDVKQTKGSRQGWWNMSPNAESFLDELITWREIGYNACCHDPNYDRYESLPDFARQTLEQHATDPREHLYSYEQFRDADTHDEIWNAAQTQLVREGRMHNYLRMLWGKKILEWTESPQQALEIMIDLNNCYALVPVLHFLKLILARKRRPVTMEIERSNFQFLRHGSRPPWNLPIPSMSCYTRSLRSSRPQVLSRSGC